MSDLVLRLIRFLERFFGAGDERRWDARSQIAAHGTGSVLLESEAPHEPGEAPTREPSTPGTMDAEESDPDVRGSLLLSVDDAGQFLVVLGRRLVLGHLRAGVADLPFLADVGPSHALLKRTDSFREGTVWTIEPLAGEHVRRNDGDVHTATALGSGDLVALGENLAFRFLVPDPASQTALLELQKGVECAGARTVVLFAEGEGGRLRIGPAAQRHIRVASLEHEITLVRRDQRLFVSCEASIRGAEAGERGFSLPCPPPQRFDLSIGKPEGARPPFGLAIGPSELMEGG